MIGVHVNMVKVHTHGTTLKYLVGAILPSCLVVSHEDYHKLYPMGDLLIRLVREMGYMHLQATKPDTIGGRYFFTNSYNYFPINQSFNSSDLI